MTLCEELYFDITLQGTKSELKKFASFLKSGELDEFFEISSEYISYEDDYEKGDLNSQATIIFSNDDYGIEIDEFDTDEFLEVFCKAGRRLYLKGQLFDADNEEYSFVSESGDSYYTNALLARGLDSDEDDED